MTEAGRGLTEVELAIFDILIVNVGTHLSVEDVKAEMYLFTSAEYIEQELAQMVRRGHVRKVMRQGEERYLITHPGDQYFRKHKPKDREEESTKQ